MSDMNGTKALALEDFCQKRGYSFIRFDYVGHGESSGTFTDGTIGLWKNNALHIIDHLTTGKLLLVGSSLGGWLMLLAALARPERIAGLVGIASAPDFTEELMWDIFSEEAKRLIQETGLYVMPSDYNPDPYPITYRLIEEGRQHLLLSHTIPITCPVRLIHGTADNDVPANISQRLSNQLTSADVQLTLMKNGDHRMSSPAALTLLQRTITSLMEDTESFA